jgi:polyhydroxyalkanoate synthesis regulator phasin
MKAKITIISLVFALLFVGVGVVNAQEASSEIKELLSGLRAQHEVLKGQVDSGELTKEDAHAQWVAIMKEAEAIKEAHYESRLARTQERIAKIAEKNPERAAELQARADASVERRTQNQARRTGLRAQVESGEVTREEARGINAGIREQNEQDHSERVAERAKREAERAERPEREGRSPNNTQ